MNILFLTPQLPYPGNSGGTIKSKHLLDYLCIKNSVTLVSLIKNNDLLQIDIFKAKYKDKVNGFLFFETDKKRSIINFIFSIINNIPISIYRNKNKNAKNKIYNEINKKKIDIIFCDHLLMAQYIPKKAFKKVILHTHNAEFIIWQRYVDIEKILIKKIIIKYEAYRMLLYEKKVCNNAFVVMAAPNDIQMLKPFVNNKYFSITYHLSYDKALKSPPIKNKNTGNLLFVGTMTWEPNVNAINWFVNNVYYLIKKEKPNIKLWIVGKYDKVPIHTKDDSIHLLGFVDKLDDFYVNSTVFICPLQYGSGMKVKVLEAMYWGLPIVTTSVGAESIDLVDGENCFIENAPDDFAKKTIILLEDNIIWEKFAKNSRKLAEDQYRWENEYERLEKILSMFKLSSPP